MSQTLGWARRRARTYDPSQVVQLLEVIRAGDSLMADLLKIMWIAGLLIREAGHPRAEDIHAEEGRISLEASASDTKGGRPRRVIVHPAHADFPTAMRRIGLERPDGHLFANRRTLVYRACMRVKEACTQLGIDCLETHSFRKSFAAQEYRCAVATGASDRQALLAVSHQLGHNRVSARSYVPRGVRVKAKGLVSAEGGAGKPLEAVDPSQAPLVRGR